MQLSLIESADSEMMAHRAYTLNWRTAQRSITMQLRSLTA